MYVTFIKEGYRKRETKTIFCTELTKISNDLFIANDKERTTIYYTSILRVGVDKLVPFLGIPAELKGLTITPQDINLEGRNWSSKWHNSETEGSAYWLCVLAAKNGSWRNFTVEEVTELYLQKFPEHKTYAFNYLTVSGDIVMNVDGSCSFTKKFIEECYRLMSK